MARSAATLFRTPIFYLLLAAALLGIPTQLAASQPPSAEPNQGFAVALDGAIAGQWQHLRLLAECQEEVGLATVELFGSGVGIWRQERQFTVEKGALRETLGLLKQAGFAAMPSRFGGGDKVKDDGILKPQNGTRGGLQIQCRVIAQIDDASKQVIQINKGEKSQAFQDMAYAILERHDQAQQTGVTAGSLADGLDKVASSTLATETFFATAHRKPPRGSSDAEWLLTLRGSRASLRLDNETTFFDLDPKQVRALAKMLRQQKFDDLPINLWAEQYTTIRVEILKHDHQVQAQNFGGAKKKGKELERFQHVFSQLDQLRQQLAAGSKD